MSQVGGIGPSAEKKRERTLTGVGLQAPSVETGTGFQPFLRSRRYQAIGAAIAACGVVALYFAFVLHYSVDDIYWDDWTVVPLIHSALHGHLTFSALWAQHGENRMLIPNLILVGVGAATHDDSEVIVFLSAVVLIASFFIYLDLLHSYLRRPLALLPVLSVGLIWFSLADYFNAIWAFQFAWYLILFLFTLTLYLLLREQRGVIVFGIALIAAIAASYSSVQGLLLWLTGLLCLLWPIWQLRERRTSRAFVELAVWTLAGVITTGIYFWRYAPKSIGQFGSVVVRPPGWAVQHPIPLARFLLVDIGNVIPSTGSDIVGHEIVGLILCITAGYVVFKCARDRQGNGQCPLPVALIAFAILFDLTVSTGRLSLGLTYAFKSRYTMPNLLLLVAIVSYAFGRVRTLRASQQNPRRSMSIAALVALAVFIVIQVVSSTEFGLSNGAAFNQEFLTGARLMVNLDRIPSSEWGCYELFGTFPNIYVTNDLPPLLRFAKSDQLGPFASGPYETYRVDGPPAPVVPHCLATPK